MSSAVRSGELLADSTHRQSADVMLLTGRANAIVSLRSSTGQPGKDYLRWSDREAGRAFLGNSLTTFPLRQIWIGKFKRACSSMTSSTASWNAISARFSIGSRRIFLESLFMRHRTSQSRPGMTLRPLYEACVFFDGDQERSFA